MEPEDALLVTCFVSSLEEQKNTQELMKENFPGAALNYVQMQREPVMPAAECEAVARARAAAPEPISFLNPPALDKSPHYSQIALVTSPKLVITGTQLAFGSQESDVKLAFERLGKALSGSNARFVHVVMSHLYLTSGALTARVRRIAGPARARTSWASSFAGPSTAIRDSRNSPDSVITRGSTRRAKNLVGSATRTGSSAGLQARQESFGPT